MEDSYLLNKDVLEKQILKINRKDEKNHIKNRPIVLLYHYPHNPTGKVLSKAEAQQVADTLNELTEKYKNLYLVQEDLYLATTRSDLGIYTPLPYLSPEAMKKTLWIHSPSKEGHGQDRGAIIASADLTMMQRVTNSNALATLGTMTAAQAGTATTLPEIARGISPRRKNASYARREVPNTPQKRGISRILAGYMPDEEAKQYANHRDVTATYYQDSLKTVGQAFVDLEKASGEKILDFGIPQGTYYLYPSLKLMKNKPIPEEFRKLKLQGKKVFDHDTIQSSNDIKLMMAHAYALGLRPITVAEGEIFTERKDELRLRLAPVDNNLQSLQEAANTVKGVIGTAMGLDLGRLGVVKSTMDELKANKHILADKYVSREFGMDIIR